MSTKAIKSSLKAAKSAIQQKEFDEALLHCKAVLREDSGNYNGLVFAGLVYAELGQFENSSTAYQDAVKSSPNQSLAYQGLINLYTKPNEAKTLELYVGLANTLCSLGRAEDSFKTLQKVCNKLNTDKFDDSLTWYEASNITNVLLTIFKGVDHISTTLIYCKSIAMFQIINCTIYYCKLPAKTDEELDSSLLAMMKCCQKDSTTYDKCLKLLAQCLLSGDITLTSFLKDLLIQIKLQTDPLKKLKVYFTEIINTKDDTKSYSSIVSEHLSPYKEVADGYDLYNDMKYEESKGKLESALQSADDFIPGWKLLCRVHLVMHQYNAAENIAKSAIQKCKHVQSNHASTWVVQVPMLSEIKLELTLLLATSMSYSRDQTVVKQAVGTFEKVRNITTTVRLENEVKNMLKILYYYVNTFHYVDRLLLKKDGDLQTSLLMLKKITEDHPSCISAHLIYGKLMWEIEEYKVDKTKCFTTFLKAAKLDPYESEAFYYIGLFYQDVIKDSTRAMKCFNKSIALDTFNEKAGLALADLYIKEENMAAAVEVYNSLSSSSTPGTCKLTWLRLGLCKLKLKETESAIKSFQAALRADANDHICWECLGEAYMQRGSHGAALKSFQKASELQPGSVFSVHQMAAIKQLLGQFTEAIEVYHQVLEMKPDYVPALKGLGESHLSIAHSMLSEGRDLTCVDHVNEALKFFAKALCLRPDIACLWSSVGDCLTCIHPLHNTSFTLSIPTTLLGKQLKDCDETKIMGKLEVLQLGEKFYLHGIRLSKSTATMLYNLGMNYFHQAKSCGDDNKAKLLASKSVEVLKISISHGSKNPISWNALGVVCASTYVQNLQLAQHCFITSINLESNNCRAWSNLGMLYLQHNHVEMAHKAFKVAQSLDPSFCNSWIGQAAIAGMIGSNEAMDLFRHSTELGLHMQAACGYSSRVCNLLYECKDRSDKNYVENIHKLNGISAAVVQLSKYCQRNPACPHSITMLAYLLEESGLFPLSEKYYYQALTLLQSELTDVKTDDKKVDRAKSNYARILYTNGKYSEAISAYKSISQPLHHDLCMLALSLYMAGKLNDSNNILDQANQMVEDTKQKDLIKLAKAIIFSELKKNKESKKALKELGNCPEALEVLCCLEISEKKHADATSVLNELYALLSHDPVAMETYKHFLLSISVKIKPYPKHAVTTLQRFIHRFPNQWQLWELLSRLVLTEPTYMHSNIAYIAANRACNLYTSDDGSQARNHHRHDKSLRQLVDDDFKVDALKAAQRLVHSHPNTVESWSILGSVCHA
uniref:Tetratricopeptide repeat protein 37 n=1 Tax=Ciona intestinalis TaxID=7719 RepID=H2XVM3_CIOIN